MNIIEIKDLVKIYDEKKDVAVTAVNGVNLGFKQGEFAAIVGPSGSGKSTLLNILGLLDTPDQTELGKDIKPIDPLSFKDSKPYKDRIKSSQKQTNENDALVTVKGHLESLDVVIACFEFKFMGGSMGSVVGEKFVEAVNTAIKFKCPFICVSSSGGARMQEGLLSLFRVG